MAGLKFGVFVGALIAILGQWAPQPAGSVALWTLVSVEAAVGLPIIWRRLRLPWFTAGAVVVFLVSLAMIPISARGLNLATIATVLPLVDVVAIWSAIVFGLLCAGLGSQRDSREWREWAACVSRATLWEMLTFKHVPRVAPLSRNDRSQVTRA
jgi:hypothetical protein